MFNIWFSLNEMFHVNHGNSLLWVVNRLGRISKVVHSQSNLQNVFCCPVIHKTPFLTSLLQKCSRRKICSILTGDELNKTEWKMLSDKMTKCHWLEWDILMYLISFISIVSRAAGLCWLCPGALHARTECSPTESAGRGGGTVGGAATSCWEERRGAQAGFPAISIP